MAKAHAAQGPRAIEKLAEWVLAIRPEDIPAANVGQTKLLILDTIRRSIFEGQEPICRTAFALCSLASPWVEIIHLHS